MIRLFVFVFAIMAYSTIGLVAFSQLTPTDQSGQTAQTSPTELTGPVDTVSSSDPNMTVVHKSTALPVVGSPDLQRCMAEGCIVGISI